MVSEGTSLNGFKDVLFSRRGTRGNQRRALSGREIESGILRAIEPSIEHYCGSVRGTLSVGVDIPASKGYYEAK